MNSKRIQSITVTREDDGNDAGTDYMGEYSARRTSEFSIDRAHDLDCQVNTSDNQPAIDAIESLISAMNTRRTSEDVADNPDSTEWEWLDTGIDFLIERQEQLEECTCGNEDGYWDNREYRYFNPSLNYVDAKGKPREGNTPEEIRKYTLQDYKRMESLHAGHWSYIGVCAKAQVVVNGTIQRVASGGLWGIEDDSDAAYLREIEDEQLSELRGILYEMGFSKRAIAAAVKDVTR